MAQSLDSFIQSSRPRPNPIATSQEIRDRGSTFVAYAYRACSSQEAGNIVQHVKHVVHGAKHATHEVSAWRCMVLRPGQSGLAGPEDFQLQTGSNDDGEKWAGDKVLKVMRSEGVLDAVVIVSRWYGGTLLGPARFSHIETCAREVCRLFKRKDEMHECMSILSSLDDILSDLRTQLDDLKIATSSASPDTPPSLIKSNRARQPDYTAIVNAEDIAKARRLINAREKAIQSVKNLIAKASLASKSDKSTDEPYQSL